MAMVSILSMLGSNEHKGYGSGKWGDLLTNLSLYYSVEVVLT